MVIPTNSPYWYVYKVQYGNTDLPNVTSAASYLNKVAAGIVYTALPFKSRKFAREKIKIMKFAAVSAVAGMLADLRALDPDGSELARWKILVNDMSFEG